MILTLCATGTVLALLVLAIVWAICRSAGRDAATPEEDAQVDLAFARRRRDEIEKETA